MHQKSSRFQVESNEQVSLERTPQDLVARDNPLHSLAGFAESIRKNLSFSSLCEDLECSTPNRSSLRATEFLGTLMLALFYGQRAYTQISALHLDHENPLLLGFKNTATSIRVRRFLGIVGKEVPSGVFARHLQASWSASCEGNWICDCLTNTKPIPGRTSKREGFVYGSLWNARESLCVGVDVRLASKPSRAMGGFLKTFLDSLPPNARPSLFRGTTGFSSEENLNAAERARIPYLFQLGGSQSAMDLYRVLDASNAWEACGSGYQAVEALLQISGWCRPRRVVFLKGSDGKILALVTSLRLSLSRIVRLHSEAPRPFSPFDESAVHWPWEGFTTGDVQSSAATAQILATFCNWWSVYNRESVSPSGRSSFDSSWFFDRGTFESYRRANLLPPILAALAVAALASGIAVTTNPALDLPPLRSLQNFTNSVLSLMKPSETYVGEDVLDALVTDEMAPLPDPNVDDVPPLDGEILPGVDLPKDEESNFWRLRPLLTTGVTFDDNIFITNSNRKSDFIFNINAGLALEFGDFRNLKENYLLLEYLATGFFFNRYTSQNSFDQAASALGQYRFENLAVQAESRYQTLSGAERQVGAFTDRSLFFNAIRLNYDYSGKTSLDFEISQRTNYYPENLSSYFYETTTGFAYSIFPKTSLGLEGIFGLSQVQESPDMWYQTLNGRLNYVLTGKTVVNATGGVQFNEYVGGGEPLRIIPVFSLGAEYSLFTKTRLSLVAYRNLQASASIAGQDYIATGGEIGINQEFASKFELGVSGGYENDTYVANTLSTDAYRVDNFFFFRPSMSYRFLKYMKASLAYEYRTNYSDLVQDTWYDNKVSLELSAQF
jgi:hypothetical protein